MILILPMRKISPEKLGNFSKIKQHVPSMLRLMSTTWLQSHASNHEITVLSFLQSNTAKRNSDSMAKLIHKVKNCSPRAY